jgi:hypothetical protein
VGKGVMYLTIALVMAMVLWVLYALFMMSAAEARTLSMTSVQRSITEAVVQQFWPRKVIMALRCKRIDRRGGQCVVRLYTLPYLDKFCGVGHAVRKGKRVKAYVSICPTPNGTPGYGHAPAASVVCRSRHPVRCYRERKLRWPKGRPNWAPVNRRWT